MKLNCDITLPASKSESNRALMIAAYGGFAPDVQNLSDSNDTLVLKEALQCLPSIDSSSRTSQRWNDIEGNQHIIDIADCGTAARFLIIPIKLKHYTLTCYGFRIGKFAYVTDLSEISKEAIEKLHGVEYLIIEALQKKKHYSHLTLDEAIEISRRIGAKRTWFTHCSHSMGLAAEVNRELPEGMMLAYDGLKIQLKTDN